MPRVLVVEDSLTQAQELAMILEDAGFEVETAPDADRGWKRLAQGGFDLVLSDLVLPGDSGFQLCRRIKADPDRRHLPVVLITRWADPANVLRGLEVGADGFITKGREPQEIVRRIHRALSRDSRPVPAANIKERVVGFLDQQYRVSAGREQLLETLLAAFEDVVQLDKGRREELASRKQAEEEIRRLNDSLEQRVAQRTAELQTSNRQLAQRNEENEMFVYSVSHDLRSPLVNLEGFSQELALVCRDLRGLLADPGVPVAVRQRGLALVDQNMAESLQFIQTAVKRLSNIIDALLRLSRAGRVEFQWQEVEVDAMVGRIVQAMRGTIAENKATVTVRELPPAWGDPTAVEQIFANLIGNALNYLDPQRPGLIEVGSLSSPLPAYYVKDNGLGIPAAYQAKLFQAFQRLHPKVAQGEGIGLAIVRRMVERHGGKVWVESSAGVGSTFFFTLPAPHRQGPETHPPLPTGGARHGQ